MNLTRRNFIKYAGGSAGAMMITSAIPMPAWAADAPGNAILTAGRWGAMYIDVKDGKIVSSRGALAKTIPNDLQTTAPDQAHTPCRIQSPMVRKGFLNAPGKPDGNRGKDEFVKVSWEDALKLQWCAA